MIKAIYYKNFFVNLIYNIYAFIINIYLCLLNRGKKKYHYNHALGFGDSFTFYLKNYHKINRQNNYALSFGMPTIKSINFFFSKKKIINIFPPIPQKLYYQVINKLIKHKNFKPKIFGSLKSEYQFKNSIYYKNLIIKSLKKFSINKNLLQNTKNDYFCLFIKHYNNDPNDISGASTRQTTNLKPIEKILVFLKNKKITTIVFGINSDKSIKKFKLFCKKNNLGKYVLFLNDISPNYLIEDQIFVAENSIGYIGSSSGPVSLFYFLRKKILILNCPKGKEIPLSFNKKNEKKFIRYLYKYTVSKKKKIIINTNNLQNYRTNIYEASFDQIKKQIIIFLLKSKTS